MPDRPALGLIETRGLVSAIEAADAAVKAAEVVIASVEVTVAALVTVKLEGELGAVKASVDAGAAAAGRIGELISAHVIPRPDDQLDAILPDIGWNNPAGAKQTPAGPTRAARPVIPVVIPVDSILESMTVVDLRRLAREQPGFPLAGREVSRANKENLIRLLRKYRDYGSPEATG